MALNAFWGNKKVVIVNVDNNQIANDIAAVLKSEHFNNVTVLDTPNSYAAYYGIAQEAPVYTLFVKEAVHPKVKLTKVEGLATSRGGRCVKRDTTESRKAHGFYKHHLKMLGLEPVLIGAAEIPFDEIKDISWFYTDKSPMLYLEIPNTEGMSLAVADAIKDYFRR